MQRQTSFPGKPKLLDQVRTFMRARRYSLRTEEAYLDWIRRFILFHGKRHPRDLGECEITEFLTDLAVHRHCGLHPKSGIERVVVFVSAILRAQTGPARFCIARNALAARAGGAHAYRGPHLACARGAAVPAHRRSRLR